MKLINIQLNTAPSVPTTYKYKVELQFNNNWIIVHTGKFFANTGESTVQLDLDDILVTNYQYVGKQSIEPVLNAANNQYQMPSSTAAAINECYYNQIRVTSLDTPSAFATATKYFYFLPVQVFGYDFSMSAGLNIPVISEGLLPRIPSNPPTGFNFSTLLYNNSNVTISATAKRDNTAIGTYNVYVYRGEYIPLSGATDAYYINDTKVASVDKCSKPYYLLWIDNKGGLQCQPFLKSSEFGRKYTNKTRIDLKNTEWKVSSTVVGNWKLKSENLNERDYRIYGEMFDSPYMVLLDMENSRLHYVNVTDTDYKEKVRTRNDHKPIFFEVNVTSSEKMRI